MPKNKEKSGAGCVKQAQEYKVEMLKNGGGKYSYDNPKELKKNSDALAKQV